MKPMLSGKAPEDLTKVKLPVVVSPKLDGYRCIVINGVACSRNLKPIRNKYVQSVLGNEKYNGYDGELIVGEPTSPTCFRDTSSGVSSFEGEPDFKFYIFDKYDSPYGWSSRYSELIEEERLIKVPHYICNHPEEIIKYEEQFLDEGYEGLMIRGINSPYKFGRSTEREGWLLKLKRFEDSEALVIGMEEKMHNSNEAIRNALGNLERSSHQENLVPLNTMGALIVRDLKTGVEFNIGTGFDDADRDWWWNKFFETHLWRAGKLNNGGIIRECMNSETVIKYKFFAQGSKDKPRFPTYLGLRDKGDM